MNIDIQRAADGATTIRIANGIARAILSTDIHGASRFELLEDGFPVRVEEWPGGLQAATRRLMADIRCKSFAGISFSTAEEMFYGDVLAAAR